MSKLNAPWHKQHPMPMKSTLDQRVEWHVAHAKACGCRDMPPTIVAALKSRRIAVPTRRSPNILLYGYIDI
jgi:hypothetical protein